MLLPRSSHKATIITRPEDSSETRNDTQSNRTERDDVTDTSSGAASNERFVDVPIEKSDSVSCDGKC
jgi:hypothetical protein